MSAVTWQEVDDRNAWHGKHSRGSDLLARECPPTESDVIRGRIASFHQRRSISVVRADSGLAVAE
ncbi:MAG: hypothetical protein P8K08_12535 [Fuerstiella sp.]|nr:hypothetical protein [Fuerstiella sp.]